MLWTRVQPRILTSRHVSRVSKASFSISRVPVHPSFLYILLSLDSFFHLAYFSPSFSVSHSSTLSPLVPLSTSFWLLKTPSRPLTISQEQSLSPAHMSLRHISPSQLKSNLSIPFQQPASSPILPDDTSTVPALPYIFWPSPVPFTTPSLHLIHQPFISISLSPLVLIPWQEEPRIISTNLNSEI